MALISTDLKFYLTGAVGDGAPQGNPNASVGRFRSGNQITSGGLHNLFDFATPSEIDYRCICIKNTNGVDSLVSALVWFSKYLDIPFHQSFFAVEVPTGSSYSGQAQFTGGESNAPTVGSGNVSSWSNVQSKGSGISIAQGAHGSDLAAGMIVFVWISRAQAGFPFPYAGESVKIRIEAA